MKWIKLGLILLNAILLINPIVVFADSPTPTPSPDAQNSSQASDLQQQINQLQQKLDAAKNQEKSLKSELDQIDSQTQLTELKIQQTAEKIKQLNLEVSDLDGRINGLSSTLDQMTNILLGRIVQTYKNESSGPLDLIFSQGLTATLENLQYIQIAQAHDKEMLYQIQATKNTYHDEKLDRQTRASQAAQLKAQLADYQTQLDEQRKTKQDLLTETQGNEATYQKLIAQDQAQLASLARFADTHSGGLVPHEDLSDSWGKYYNQRDSNWGNQLIGLSSEQVWQVGCLLTSYTMVATHFGASITPSNTASNIDNFALGTAYFKIPGPTANGHSSQYVTNPSISYLKSQVSAGHPIVAGLSADGGPYPIHYSDHWIVIRGLDSNGGFLINDPWYAGAMDVPLSSHYAGWSIIEARVYN